MGVLYPALPVRIRGGLSFGVLVPLSASSLYELLFEAIVTRGASVSLGLALASISRFAAPYAQIVMGAGFPVTICAGVVWATRRVHQASFAAVRPVLRVAVMLGWARPAGCRTTLHRMIDSQSETSGGTVTFINAVPSSFRPLGSIMRVQGGDGKRYAVPLGWALAFQAA